MAHTFCRTASLGLALATFALTACGGNATDGAACAAGQPNCTPAPGNACAAIDTDGDGYSDDVEIAIQSDANDAADSPAARGQLVFVVPYQGAPSPPHHDVVTTTKLARADVAILLDTTGSMTGTTTRLKPQLATMVSELASEVPSLAFGVAGFGDFPYASHDNSDRDRPFYLVHRMMTAHTDAGLASITNALTHQGSHMGYGAWLTIMRGGDEPEQGWEALRQTATGVGITYPHPWNEGETLATPAFSAATAYPQAIPEGEEAGDLGGYGFRRDSLPIIIQITDTSFHAGGWTAPTPNAATRQEAIAAVKQIGGKVIGMMASGNRTGLADLRYAVSQTNGFVTPAAWGTGSERPENCPVDKCCLQAVDAYPPPQPDPVDGRCELIFSSDFYSYHVASMVVQAVVAIARGMTFTIAAAMRDDAADAVDTAPLVQSVVAVPDGACAQLQAADQDGDGVADSYLHVTGGTDVCFRLNAAPNGHIPPQPTAQAYKATLVLTGDGVAAFSPQDVWFVVPGEGCADGPAPPVF